MENKEPVNHRENLKQDVLKRVALVVVGCIVLSILSVIVPALYLVPVGSVTVIEAPAPPEAPLAPTPPLPPAPPGSTAAVPILAFVPPLILLALVGLIIYGIYDAVRLFMRYRKRERDEQMFP